MKTLLNLLFVCVAGLTLVACESAGLGNFDSEPPYAMDRTATADHAAAPAPAPEPAPKKCDMCEKSEKPDCGGSCKKCESKDARIAALEAELAACREASNRVRDAYTDTLKK